MRPFEQRVAFVTGAASGIGRATACAFAEAGAAVALVDVDEDGLEGTRALLDPAARALTLPTDVASPASVALAVEQTVVALGSLDVGHNNAGIAGEQKTVADTTDDEFEQLVATNLKGVFVCMREQLRHMRAHGGGVIVNTASVQGLVGVQRMPVYAATKGGIIALTRAAALDHVGDGIRINAIAPGAIDTPMLRGDEPDADPNEDEETRRMIPMGRVGGPEEIARAVLWLCSDAASYVTGQTLAVDGGWTIH